MTTSLETAKKHERLEDRDAQTSFGWGQENWRGSFGDIEKLSKQ